MKNQLTDTSDAMSLSLSVQEESQLMTYKAEFPRIPIISALLREHNGERKKNERTKESDSCLSFFSTLSPFLLPSIPLPPIRAQVAFHACMHTKRGLLRGAAAPMERLSLWVLPCAIVITCTRSSRSCLSPLFNAELMDSVRSL